MDGMEWRLIVVMKESVLTLADLRILSGTVQSLFVDGRPRYNTDVEQISAIIEDGEPRLQVTFIIIGETTDRPSDDILTAVKRGEFVREVRFADAILA